MRTLLALLVALAFQCAEAKSAKSETYLASLAPLKSVTKLETSGEARFTIENDDAAPGIAHLQHFHGFKTGHRKATCPTTEADANHDGANNLIETDSITCGAIEKVNSG